MAPCVEVEIERRPRRIDGSNCTTNGQAADRHDGRKFCALSPEHASVARCRRITAATRLIRKCISDGQALFVPVSVSLELEWALRSNFGFAKDAVIQTLSQLLSAAELWFDSEAALELALSRYRDGTADYADCLHAALAAQASEPPLWTFDKAASKLDGARLLAP